MSVIVLDGQLKSALASVRSLGEKGIPVIVGGVRTSVMAAHSKYVQRFFVHVSPKKDRELFLEQVLAEAKRVHEETAERPVIFCFSDDVALILSLRYDALEPHAIMVLPSKDSFEIANDKFLTYEHARRLSIPTIRTYEEEEFAEVVYPAVIKNRHSVVFKDGEMVSGSAEFVFSLEELRSRFAAIREKTGEAPLVMEFIKGEEYGIELVCEKGKVLSGFAHRRIRSLSPRGGAAVVKETAPESEEVRMMRHYAHALAESLLWEGPIMVEFKLDAKDGRVVLMEINGRFWGSLPLAIKAGIDFPLHVYELAHGRTIEAPQQSLPYVRTRHFLGDCKWLLSVFFGKDRLRNTLYPPRWRALLDFKLEIFRSRGDILSLNDPMPSFYEYIDHVRKWLK